MNYTDNQIEKVRSNLWLFQEILLLIIEKCQYSSLVAKIGNQ
ncbi:hypothetical protein [Geminocystis herdmanii]|nr:hypothetical protein [Geminocystis herdmanii]